jgi:hypothetical protein
MKNKIHIISGMLLMVSSNISAQHFRYKRSLQADSIGWNRIYLPPQVEAKCRTDFADLRVFAIKKNGDTVESSYMIKDPGNQVIANKAPLKILNRSEAGGSYYYTFEKNTKYYIEEISLAFENKNFDSRVILEGSHNQKEWFTILKDYRILSIENQATKYAFTNLIFPEASYSFYRLQIQANTNPGLVSATVMQHAISKATWHTHKILSQQSEINKELKQTIFTFKLEEALPVSCIQVHTAKQGDFFRATNLLHVRKQSNSNAENEIRYQSFANFTLSSLGSNSFQIPKIQTNELRLVVENKDDEPLRIDSVNIKTTLPELWVRLPEAETYLMVYGDAKARSPQYDAALIVEQTNPVPFTSAILGEELELLKATSNTENLQWYEKDIYLYGIMAVIMALLGYFSITMIRKKQ